tara:strand:+ start:26638 stop:26742 length:105 start_codon:yes stop_codon:yes gene_type:complete
MQTNVQELLKNLLNIDEYLIAVYYKRLTEKNFNK